MIYYKHNYWILPGYKTPEFSPKDWSEKPEEILAIGVSELLSTLNTRVEMLLRAIRRMFRTKFQPIRVPLGYSMCFRRQDRPRPRILTRILNKE